MRKLFVRLDLIARTLFVVLMLSLITCGVVSCTSGQWAQVQKDANGVYYVTTPGSVSPTTQSSVALDTGKVVVQAAATANPLVGTIVGIVSIVSGLVAGFAGLKAGTTVGAANGNATVVTAQKTNNAVLSEIAHAVTGVLPGPWSQTATDALKAAGLHDFADPNAPVPIAFAPAQPAAVKNG